MSRKNRRIIGDEVHNEVWANPAGFTRASRRAAGYRSGVHVEAMREFYAGNRVLPRAVRRLFRDPGLARVRTIRNRAKVNRLLAPYGVTA